MAGLPSNAVFIGGTGAVSFSYDVVGQTGSVYAVGQPAGAIEQVIEVAWLQIQPEAATVSYLTTWNGLGLIEIENGGALLLYGSDGSATGTDLLASLSGSPQSNSAWILGSLGGRLFLAAQTNDTLVIFGSDATASGTQILEQVSWVPSSGAGATVTTFGEASGRFVFAVTNADTLTVYGADGTASGTEALAQLSWTSASTVGGAAQTFGWIDGRMLFWIGDGDTLEVYGSDGSSAGTQRLARFPGQTTLVTLATLGQSEVFVASVPGGGALIYSTDGGGSGTSLLATLASGTVVTNLGAVGQREIFLASIPGVGAQVYGTDGTTAGTALLEGFSDGVTARSVALVGSHIVFLVETASDAVLCGADGTVAGDQALGTFAAGAAVSTLGSPEAGAALLEVQSAGDTALYGTDGTSAGTPLLVDAGSGSVQLIFQGSGKDPWLFAVTKGAQVTLYATDGATAATVATYSPGSRVTVVSDGGKDDIGVTPAGAASQRCWVNETTGAISAAGDEYLWAGPISGGWDAASDWNDETADENPAPTAPGANDSVTIASSGAAAQAITGAGAAAYLTIAGPTALEGRFVAGTLSATAALTVGSGYGLTVSGAATLTSAGDALTVDGSLTAASMIMNGGGYTVGTGGTLSVSGNVATTEANAWSTVAVSGGRFLVEGTLYSDGETAASSLSATANGEVRLGDLSYGQTSAGTGSPLLTGIGLATDATSSIEIGSAGGAAPGAITVDSGVSVDEFGTFAAANVIDDGVIAVTPGQTLTLAGTAAGGLSGGGEVAIGAGSTLIVTGLPNASPSTTIAFDGEGGTLSIARSDLAGEAFRPQIAGFDGGDSILFQGVVTAAAYASGVLTLLDGTSTVAELELPESMSALFSTIAAPGGATQINLRGGGDTATRPPGTAGADQYLWTGPMSGSWDAASDWNDETADENPAPTAPGANDSVTIASSGAAAQAITGAGAAAYLTIAGPTALEGRFVAGTLSATAALTVGSGYGLTVSGAATLTSAGDALTVDGSLTAASMIMNGGGYTVGTGGTLSVSGNVTTTEANAWSTVAVSGGRFLVEGTLYSDGETAASSLSATANGEVRLGDLSYGQTSAGTGSPLLTGIGLATDATSSIEIGSAGGAAPGAITVDSGVSVDEFGTFAAANVIDDGVIAVTPGQTLTLAGTAAGGLSGGGEVAIGAGSTLIVTGLPNASPSTTIAFDGEGGTLSIAPSDLAGEAFRPQIAGFDGGDSILFQGVVTAAAYASGVLTLLDGTSTVAELELAGGFAPDGFSVTAASGGISQIALAQDTAPPLTVTFASLSFDGAGVSGGQPTTGDPVAFSGTVAGAQPVARVEVYDGAQDLGAATVTGDAWSLTTTLDAGPHASFTAIATDLAGDSAVASIARAIDVAPLPVDVSQTTPYTLGASQSDFIFGPSTNIAVSSSGSIAAVSGALGVEAQWTLTNEGVISGTGGTYPPSGLMFDTDATVTNASGATIAGGSFGVDIFGAATVVNSGAITGPTATAAATGTDGGEGISVSLGGSITNNSGAIISGARYGVAITGGAGSVTNAGSIGGGLGSVVFSGAFADTLTIEPGSTLSGDVVVAGGASLTVTGLATGVFVIESHASIAFATPDGFGPGDGVDFEGVPYASGDVVFVAGVGANQMVEIVTAAGAEAAAFAAQGNEAQGRFIIGPDGNGGLEVARAATIADFLADPSRLNSIAGGFAVSDAAATIAAYLTASVPAGPSALALDAAHVTAITASDGNPVTVGGGVFAADQAALDRIVGGFSISGQASVLNGDLAGLEADRSRINAVAARNPQSRIVGLTATIAQFGADEPILNKSAGGFAVSDAAATIAAYLTASVPAGPSALALDAANVTAITASDGNPVTVGGGVFAADQAALDRIVGGFSISGQASVLNGDLAGLEADRSRINAVAARNPQSRIVGLTATIAQFGADEPILNKSTGGFAVSDAAATIAAYLAASVPAGPSALAMDAAYVTAITASDGNPVTVGGGVFAADQAALDRIVGGFSISGKASVLSGKIDGLENDIGHINAITSTNGVITGTMANFDRDGTALNRIAGGFDVNDTAANVTAGLDLLLADVAHIVAITLTDATRPTLTLTTAQASADQAILARIASPYTLNVV